MKKLLLAIFIIFSSFTRLAADEINEFSTRILNELDVGKKGYITKKDVEVFSKKEFIIMDKNSDGVVSREEFLEFVCDKNCKAGNCECKSYENKMELDYIGDYWNRINKHDSDSITFREKLMSDMETFNNLDSKGRGKVTREDIESQFY